LWSAQQETQLPLPVITSRNKILWSAKRTAKNSDFYGFKTQLWFINKYFRQRIRFEYPFPNQYPSLPLLTYPSLSYCSFIYLTLLPQYIHLPPPLPSFSLMFVEHFLLSKRNIDLRDKYTQWMSTEGTFNNTACLYIVMKHYHIAVALRTQTNIQHIQTHTHT